MSRRQTRQPYSLHPRRRSEPLSREEINIVLRGADELIAAGGRALLAKILKGSRDRRVLGHGLNQNPVYGVWHDRSIEEITGIIDLCIVAGFLAVTYSGRLPVLEFTDVGWEWERRQRVEEFLAEWDRWLDAGVFPATMEYLKDRNRVMITEFLERVRATGDSRYIPLLERWAQVDYKKVRAMIEDVMADLSHTDDQ